jgi:hypothetical protein
MASRKTALTDCHLVPIAKAATKAIYSPDGLLPKLESISSLPYAGGTPDSFSLHSQSAERLQANAPPHWTQRAGVRDTG